MLFVKMGKLFDMKKVIETFLMLKCRSVLGAGDHDQVSVTFFKKLKNIHFLVKFELFWITLKTDEVLISARSQSLLPIYTIYGHVA